jgi:hypothetical protein
MERQYRPNEPENFFTRIWRKRSKMPFALSASILISLLLTVVFKSFVFLLFIPFASISRLFKSKNK